MNLDRIDPYNQRNQLIQFRSNYYELKKANVIVKIINNLYEF